MIICPKCGHEQEGGKFCGSCGTTMNEQTKPSLNERDSVAYEEQTNEERVEETVETEAGTDERIETIEERETVEAPEETVIEETETIREMEDERENERLAAEAAQLRQKLEQLQREREQFKLTEEQLERIEQTQRVLKENGKTFFSFYKRALTKPSNLLKETDIRLSSSLLLLFVLGHALLIGTMLSKIPFSNKAGVFFTGFGYTAFYIGLTLIIGPFVHWLFTKMYGIPKTFKSVLHAYGTFYAIPATLSVVSFIGITIFTENSGFFMFILTLSFATAAALPFFLMIRELWEGHLNKQIRLDPWISYLLWTVGLSIAYSFTFAIIMENFFNQVMREINFF